MISTAIFIENGPEAEARRLPTDKEMRIISTEEARRLFGTEAERLDGVSVSTLVFGMSGPKLNVPCLQWLANDPKQLYVSTVCQTRYLLIARAASPTTTIGLRSSSSVSGAPIPPWTPQFLPPAKHPFLPHGGSCSRT